MNSTKSKRNEQRRNGPGPLRGLLLAAVALAPLQALPDYCNARSPDGITVDTTAQRLVSVHREPVRFPDARGRRDARVMAVERAKGAVVRYLDQRQQTLRSVEDTTEIETNRSRTTGNAGQSAEDRVSRNMRELLRRVEQSFAEGRLRGLLLLEEQYDAENETLCVAMGVSARSADAAGQVIDWMAATPTPRPETQAEAPEEETPAPENASYLRKRTGEW